MILLLSLAVAVIVLAALGMYKWFGWVGFGIFGGLVLLIPLVIAFFTRDRVRLVRDLLSWFFALVCGGLATTALAYAILLHSETPGWLFDRFHLESGAEGAALPWVRWALVVVAIALVLIPRLWNWSVWPDVAVALFVVIGAYAIVEEHHQASKASTTTTPPPRVTFTLPQDHVSVLGAVDTTKKAKAIVLFIRPKTVEGTTVLAYMTQRFKAKRVKCRKTPGVCVSVVRGAEDAKAISFSTALEAATKIYVMPQTAA